MKKSFLFLQGPQSPFFAKLGTELLAQGNRVLRINFNAGDKLFWKGEHTAEYRLSVNEFNEYISNISRLRKITDLVIYDDSKPIHAAAIEALKNQKIRIHVFGEGIFGEKWVTLEDRIFGDKTLLPKDPRFYLRHKQPYVKAQGTGFGTYAKKICNFKYYAAQKMGENKSAVMEEAINNPLAVKPLFKKHAENVKNKAKLSGLSYFLADYEMSKKASLIRSFAKNASEGSNLVFATRRKATEQQLAKTADLAAKYGVSGRVIVLENANIAKLMNRARAYITNNSFDALIAIRKSKPVLARTNAIYNLEGLTSQLPLDNFWQNAERPDSEVFRKFRSYVIAKTQVNGSFYTRKGMNMLVRETARKILGKESAEFEDSQFSAS